MFRCRIYRTEPKQAPKDYAQVWDQVEIPASAPENAELLLILEDETREPIERAVLKYIDFVTRHYYALGKSHC
jgi:hypothetical protein